MNKPELKSYLEKNDPVWGSILAALLALGSGVLNRSFRWGKDLSITWSQSVEIYATDCNVLPLSYLPYKVSKKDFSVVVWVTVPYMPGIVV